MEEQPRTARGRATRERIVRAATELVGARGVAGTSLDDVREAARASKSQLYLYFADRDELMRAVARSTCDTVLETQSDPLAGFDSIAGIERYLDWLIALQVELDTPGCPMGTLAGQLVQRDEASRAILAGGLERWQRSLQTGLEAMGARGELRPEASAERLATQTLLLLQGGLMLSHVHSDTGQMRLPADTVVEHIRDACLPARTAAGETSQ